MNVNTTNILNILAQQFPSPKSELNFNSVFELTVAVILSAQCTDKRVNLITPILFEVANTPQKMIDLGIKNIEKIIYSCGFYKNKAKYLYEMSVDLVNKYNSVVPKTLQELSSLSGIGRKTANVVYSVGFNGNAIAVDTHVFRVANRLGITSAKNTLDTEKQLMREIDENLWSDSHHYILLHGRYVCKSQTPLCSLCKLTEYCNYFKEKKK